MREGEGGERRGGGGGEEGEGRGGGGGEEGEGRRGEGRGGEEGRRGEGGKCTCSSNHRYYTSHSIRNSIYAQTNSKTGDIAKQCIYMQG